MSAHSKILSKPEDSAAYNLPIDLNVDAIGADAEFAGAQIIDVLTAIDSKI